MRHLNLLHDIRKWYQAYTQMTPKGKYIVTDLINALPGDSSLNTFQRATVEAVSQ
jgi:radical SAM superfamily enzyme